MMRVAAVSRVPGHFDGLEDLGEMSGDDGDGRRIFG